MTLPRILIASLALLTAGFASTQEAPERVNINTADAATLARVLDGVGLKKAEAIVAHREANGRFDSADALTSVKGIGNATVERNAAKIRVSEGDEHAPEPPETPAPGDD